MTNKPIIEVKYGEPSLPGSGIQSQDDVASVLHKERLLETRVYPGSVDTAGNARTVFPFKWAVSRVGTGHFRIVHNLGHTKYVVVTTATDVYAYSDTVIANITAKTTTYVDITWSTSTGLSINQYFDFILVALI